MKWFLIWGFLGVYFISAIASGDRVFEKAIKREPVALISCACLGVIFIGIIWLSLRILFKF